ncbi:MAG: NrfD/PsrC family molybdoenzyme membrane anchor subunit [Dehalococcoidia bacterium]
MRLDITPKPVAIPLGMIWVAAFTAGLVGIGLRLTSGHELANYTSSIPWGLWVAAYVYFVGLSAGAFLISALIFVFGMKSLEPIGKLALFTALMALVAALLTIWLDLGHMERFYYVFTRGNPGSMMAWMVWLYTAYFFLLIIEFWVAIRGDLVSQSSEAGLRGRVASLLLGKFGRAFGPRPRLAVAHSYDRTGDRQMLKILGSIGVPLAIAFHGGVGALFGVVGARGYWNAPLYPLLFIVGALVSGGGLLTFIVAFLWPEKGTEKHREMVVTLGRMTLAMLAVYLIMVWAEFSITLYADIPSEAEPLYQILGGPYPWVFWVFQVGLGAVIPIAIMTIRGKSIPWVGLAAGLVALGFFATRLNVVIPGLLEPQLDGLDTAYIDNRLEYEYFPSVMEWLVLAFIGSFATGLFFLGTRLLPLTDQKQEVSQ